MSHTLARALVALTLALAASIAFAAPRSKHSIHAKTHHPTTPALVWRGDLATSRPLMTDLAKAWHEADHGSINVAPFSTLSGLDAAVSGAADFAGSARSGFAKRNEEAGLTFVPVAWDALVMVVQDKNPARNVTLKQLHDIYYGKIDNWQSLGGPAHPINLYSVASPLDGVEYSLREYLFRRGNQPVASLRLYINTEQLEAAITLDPYGLGVTTLSAALQNRRLRMLDVDGVAPNLATVADGSYPLYTPLYFVLPASGAHAAEVHEFMEFLGSPAAHAVMRANHVLPFDPTAALALNRAAHLVAMQNISNPPMNGPVAAPAATFVAGAAQAPTSQSTLAARSRMEAARNAEAAAKTQPATATVKPAARKAQPAAVKPKPETKHTAAHAKPAPAAAHAKPATAKSASTSSKARPAAAATQPAKPKLQPAAATEAAPPTHK